MFGNEARVLTCLKQWAGAAIAPVSFKYLSQLKWPKKRSNGENISTLNAERCVFDVTALSPVSYLSAEALEVEKVIYIAETWVVKFKTENQMGVNDHS